jgi:fido (protein-threonine AMPylation protein)
MNSPSKGKRLSIAGLFPSLEIGSASTSTSSKPLITSLRQTFSKGFPHWGSLKGKATRVTFTICQHQGYDYSFTSDDPDELFEAAQAHFVEIQSVVGNLGELGSKKFEEFMGEAFCEVIFGSNAIENAGVGHAITIRICKEIFQSNVDPATIELRTKEQEEAIQNLTDRNITTNKNAILRSRKEIVQHAMAFKYIITHMILYNEQLSEKLIKETHKVLTDGLDSDDGDKSSTYSGQYRTLDVIAGMNGAFTQYKLVPSAMTSIVKEFNQDITTAEKEGELDPYALAAKYCHKFINVHPFLDGNGRVCRLILNAILLKYAGIVVPIGEKGDDRVKYMEIANRATQAEQVPEDERSRFAWAELASYVIEKGAAKMETLRNTLRSRKA